MYEEINEEVRDCAMEIVNILIGQLKASMAEHEANNDGFTFTFSLPKLMVGHTVDGSPTPGVESITVQFSSEHGPIAIQTDYKLEAEGNYSEKE